MTQDASAQAQGMARRAVGDRKLHAAARAGFVVSGLMHLLIGWIALQVAFGGNGKPADQSGALGELASNSGGRVLLWIGVVGFLGLAAWNLVDALLDRPGQSNQEKLNKAKSLAKGLVYAALAVTTFQYARVGGGASSSKQSQDFTASLLRAPGGRVLVVVLGLVVIAVGGYHVVKGAKKRFRADLAQTPPHVVERLAMAGYIAKGVALAVVGLLFDVAGLYKDAAKASGLDGALKALRDQPFGTLLLSVVALGIIAYGLYSFARAKYARL